MKFPDKIYEDEENNVLFFDLRSYISELRRGILVQDENSSYYITRNINIHLLWEHNMEKVYEVLKKHPEVKSLFRVYCSKGDGKFSVDYKFFRKEIKLNELKDWDRIFIDRYTVFRKGDKLELGG